MVKLLRSCEPLAHIAHLHVVCDILIKGWLPQSNKPKLSFCGLKAHVSSCQSIMEFPQYIIYLLWEGTHLMEHIIVASSIESPENDLVWISLSYELPGICLGHPLRRTSIHQEFDLPRVPVQSKVNVEQRGVWEFVIYICQCFSCLNSGHVVYHEVVAFLSWPKY